MLPILTTNGVVPAQQRKRGASHLDRREEIRLQHATQRLGIGVGETPQRAAPGVVDQRVETAPVVGDRADRGRAVFGPRDVPREDRRSFGVLRVCYSPIAQPLGPSGEHQDACAMRKQRVGQRSADAARGAGHDRAESVQRASRHRLSGTKNDESRGKRPAVRGLLILIAISPEWGMPGGGPPD
ncbi:MAG: hypothetical protein QM811_08090 [Pirellulales bacterium]